MLNKQLGMEVKADL